MSTQLALVILDKIKELTDSSKSLALAQGRLSYWQRDEVFISDLRDCLLTNNLENVRWVYSQMRNFSQGFGTYCADSGQLDCLLDDFYSEIERVLSE